MIGFVLRAAPPDAPKGARVEPAGALPADPVGGPLTLTRRAPISGARFCGGKARRYALAPCQWPRANANGTEMANTKSAKKATRKIGRRTEVNKTRRSRMRTFVRSVEDAIANGDKTAAAAALKAAEPELIRAAQKGVVHKRTASRKVSRLAHQVAKLG